MRVKELMNNTTQLASLTLSLTLTHSHSQWLTNHPSTLSEAKWHGRKNDYLHHHHGWHVISDDVLIEWRHLLLLLDLLGCCWMNVQQQVSEWVCWQQQLVDGWMEWLTWRWWWWRIMSRHCRRHSFITPSMVIIQAVVSSSSSVNSPIHPPQ